MAKQNPKQEGSNVCDCRVQTGLCPIDCNQCFYNRDNGKAFYCDINEPNIPTIEEVGKKIVRMNSGHDSNLEKDTVIEAAKKYKHFFFNTSIPNFDFPGPVVFTANPKEEEFVWHPLVEKGDGVKRIPIKQLQFLDNLMFIRLRASITNIDLLRHAITGWTGYKIPIILTFMAYYDDPPVMDENLYTWKKRHINSYWCPTQKLMKHVLSEVEPYGHRLVTICGRLDSNWCRDCHNCETYYWQAKKRLDEKIWISS